MSFYKGKVVTHPRPKNLNLFTIYFPIPAIVSFLHRVTGVVLFLLIPIILWLLQYSLTDTGFEEIHRLMQTIYFKAIFWIFLTPFCFHLVAGIRHLLSDIHIGDRLSVGRATAWLTFIITFILMILVGIWLW